MINKFHAYFTLNKKINMKINSIPSIPYYFWVNYKSTNPLNWRRGKKKPVIILSSTIRTEWNNKNPATE